MLIISQSKIWAKVRVFLKKKKQKMKKDVITRFFEEIRKKKAFFSWIFGQKFVPSPQK